MRKMLINVMAVVSLILLVLVVVVWVSGTGGYEAGGPGGLDGRPGTSDTTWFLASRGGGLRVMRQQITAFNASRVTADGGRLGFMYIRQDGGIIGTVRHGSLDPAKTFLGAGWGDRTFTKRISMFAPEPVGGVFVLRYSVVAVPYWAMMLLGLVFPGLWCRGWRVAAVRRAKGLCANCGYDLRSSSLRCPECGAALATSV